MVSEMDSKTRVKKSPKNVFVGDIFNNDSTLLQTTKDDCCTISALPVSIKIMSYLKKVQDKIIYFYHTK